MGRDNRLLERWRSTLELARPWDPPPRPTVVVSPHPDDETLSSGGLISRQRQRGVRLIVIAVTDGERAYPEDPADALAAARREEQHRALDRLGVAACDVHRLGIPDGHAAEHVDTVRHAILDHVDPETLLIAPWSRDVHPDHEAVGRAAEAAAATAGCLLVASLFWTWHEHDPTGLADVDLVSLPLTPDELDARRDALAEHRSQLQRASGEPILPTPLLAPTRWPFEVFVAAPGNQIRASGDPSQR